MNTIKELQVAKTNEDCTYVFNIITKNTQDLLTVSNIYDYAKQHNLEGNIIVDNKHKLKLNAEINKSALANVKVTNVIAKGTYSLINFYCTTRLLKRVHKHLHIYEAAFVYITRHKLNMSEDYFIDNILMSDNFSSNSMQEFDNLAKDLLCYRTYDSYKLIELTIDEYESAVDKFGSN
jgi:hypothetical protein